MNVRGAHITNVYVNKTVIVNNRTANRVSYDRGAAAPEALRLRWSGERRKSITFRPQRNRHGTKPPLAEIRSYSQRTTAASRPSAPRRDPLTFPPRAQYRPKPRAAGCNPQLGKTGRKRRRRNRRLRQQKAQPLYRIHPQARHTLRPATTLPSRLARTRTRILKLASRTRRQPALTELTRKSKRQSIQNESTRMRVLFFARVPALLTWHDHATVHPGNPKVTAQTQQVEWCDRPGDRHKVHLLGTHQQHRDIADCRMIHLKP